jgi:hypothetical protein
VVCNEEQLLIPVTNKNAPKKMTVKSVKSPWTDEELKNCMVRGMRQKVWQKKSGSQTNWQTYCKLRNHVTKLNKIKTIL